MVVMHNLDKCITIWVVRFFLDINACEWYNICGRFLIGWRARNTKLPGTVDKVGPGDIKRITVRVVESVFDVLSRNDVLVVLQYGKNEISTCFRCDCV